jgi:hypothetical protein
VGTATATQPLTAECYLTDETVLLYVLGLTTGPVDGRDGEITHAVIENVRTGEVTCIEADSLESWRLVIPEGTDG